jgi:putative oxidoreductase
MTSIAETSAPRFSAIGAVLQIRRYLEAVPYSVLALPLRLAIATVFWNSGMTKLADWNTALALFTDEYHVPLLPPEVAAYLSATIELTTPPLLVMGLLTRPVAFVLLGMTTVIEVFVYPEAWPTHIQWAAMLLVLLFRGAGSLSLDYLVYRRVASSPDLPA